MSLRLAFWNVGMGPRVRLASAEREQGLVRAADTVRELFEEEDVALVGLCEVDGLTAAAMSERLHMQHAHIVVDEDVGRTQWDLAVFFKTDRILCTKEHACQIEERMQWIKAGYSFDVVDRANSVTFALFLAHWPSRLSDQKRAKAELAGDTLWYEVKRRLDDDKPVVVMGDFNDEPFDSSIQQRLRATRDPEHAAYYRASRLYNPSWWLSCPAPGAPWAPFGSTSRQPEAYTNHHLLDQVLVSAHFLDKDASIAPVCRRLPVPSSQSTGGRMSHIPIGVDLL